MVIDPKTPSKTQTYQAPALFVSIFYLLLAAWVVMSALFLNAVFADLGLAGLYRLIIIAFILFYMCYLALAISYKIEVWDVGDIRLTSFRGTIKIHADEILKVEGPYLPLGFIKVQLKLKKVYLFCLSNSAFLKSALLVISKANPHIPFKRL